MFKIFLDFLITHNSQTKATKTCLALKYKLIAIYFKLPSVHESYIFHKIILNSLWEKKVENLKLCCWLHFLVEKIVMQTCFANIYLTFLLNFPNLKTKIPQIPDWIILHLFSIFLVPRN